jgi:hypothetical protein
MAGKTLTGIGEDESGRHATDRSGPILEADPDVNTDKAPSTRATDRMAMFASPAGGPAVDEDKVAEGLKKLRSLDEPLGPIPSSMPTLKEGIPAIGGAPTHVNPASVAAAAAAELLRSRGTAHGHALSVAAGVASSMPVSVDDRMKGTLLGHSLHLPDLPPESPQEENRPAEVREVARTVTPNVIVHESVTSDFSHGDSRFFETEAGNSEYEPENPRGKLMARGAIFVAIVSVFVVAAIAWVRVHRVEAPAPTEARATPPAPSAADNPSGIQVNVPVAPAEGAQAAAPTAAAPPPPPPAPAPAPTAAAVPAAEPPPPAPAPEEVQPAAPPAEPAAASPPPRSHARHREPSVLAAPTAPARAAHPAAPHDTKTTATLPGKRSKEEDPDGTLPMTE